VDEAILKLHAEVMQAKAAIADAVFAVHKANAEQDQAQKRLAIAEAQLAGATALIEAARAVSGQENTNAVNVGT
jgi:hypothetical protein